MARRAAENRIDLLPAEVTQARRFGKARSAQSTALLEDYVELIADLLATTGEARPTDIARRLGVSHPTAINTITRLKREALAPGLQPLTLLVSDLLLALSIPSQPAEADAECTDHHVSEAALKSFA